MIAAPARPAIVPVARLCGLLLLPAVVVLRTGVQPSWWHSDGPWGTIRVAVAVAWAALGTWWLWVSTREPYALRPGTRRELAAARTRHAQHTDAPVRLLDDLRTEALADDAWARFEGETGLVVPASTRTVIGPATDPSALARYLSARQQRGPAGPQSLGLVILVPFLACLLPAAVLLLLA